MISLHQERGVGVRLSGGVRNLSFTRKPLLTPSSSRTPSLSFDLSRTSPLPRLSLCLRSSPVSRPVFPTSHFPPQEGTFSVGTQTCPVLGTGTPFKRGPFSVIKPGKGGWGAMITFPLAHEPLSVTSLLVALDSMVLRPGPN